MFISLLERALSLALANQGTLLRTGWAYIALLAAINFAIGSAVSSGNGFSTVSYMTEPVRSPDEGGLRLLAMLANVLIGFSIAIAYVRRILINARDFPLTVSKRTVTVILNQLILTIIGLLALIPLIVISGIAALFTAGLGFFLLAFAPFISLMVVQKFSVILPAAAVDDTLSLGESWRATKGLGWPMAFAALVMSIVTGVLIGLWYLVLFAIAALTSADTTLELIRSALFPLGAVLLTVWGFASLHATFYGLIRERYAARLGLSHDIYERVETSRQESREQARSRAARAVNSVKRLRRP